MLGPLLVERDESTVDVGPPKQRAVLAMLLLAQGRVVSVDRLIDAVWGDDVPGSATAGLQAYVVESAPSPARRHGVGADGVTDRAPIAGLLPRRGTRRRGLHGVRRGLRRAAAAAESADWADALAETDAALALWRGPFLADLRDQEWAEREAARAEEMRRECLDSRITALLALGRVPAALADAGRLRDADPLSDRGWWLHMMPRPRRRTRTGSGRRAARVADGDPAPGPELVSRPLLGRRWSDVSVNWIPWQHFSSTSCMGPPVDDALTALREHVGAPVALPGERVYERAVPWNVAVPVHPGAVVLATGATDVAAVMRFAAARGLKVAVQATGHGALPIGADTILVQTSGLSGCVVDVPGRSARVGAGATWQQVLDAATPYGLAPLCGSAPGVGVVGYLTGGGIGPLVRSVGLSADHVRAFELVTGAGEVLHVTPDEHADLFWGVRGGKSALGIVTEVEIDLLPIAEFYGGALYFDGADAARVLHAWRGGVKGCRRASTRRSRCSSCRRCPAYRNRSPVV